MKYSLKKLSDDKLFTLKKMVNECLSNSNNPKLGRVDEYAASSTFFVPQNNLELVNLINNITENKTDEINSFFHIIYNVGDRLPKHRDRSNHQIKKNPEKSISYSFLLNMCEEGGEFLLNNSDINFNQPGQYVYFDGHEIVHEIKEVKKGKREVLVIWYRPKKQTHLI
jgi:hypothetical protein